MDRDILTLLLARAHNVTVTRREMVSGVPVSEEEYFFDMVGIEREPDLDDMDAETVTVN